MHSEAQDDSSEAQRTSKGSDGCDKDTDLVIMQLLPAMNVGGVERGVLDVSKYMLNQVQTLSRSQG
eukprot:1980777-Rhodomonas_salina.3